MIRYFETPPPILVDSLGWDIREVRAIGYAATLGCRESQFTRWENVMVEITARIWCDDSVVESDPYFARPLVWSFRDPGPNSALNAPEGFEEAWEGFLDLFDTSDGSTFDWLIDEWIVWRYAHELYAIHRMKRQPRILKPVCTAHGDQYGWRRKVPICEALNTDADWQCEQIANSGGRPPPFAEQYVGRFMPDRLKSN